MGPTPNKLTGTPQKVTAHSGGTISSSGTGYILGKIQKRTYKTITPWTDYFRRQQSIKCREALAGAEAIKVSYLSAWAQIDRVTLRVIAL